MKIASALSLFLLLPACAAGPDGGPGQSGAAGGALHRAGGSNHGALPKCAHVVLPAAGSTVTLDHVGDTGLVVAVIDGTPLCKDTLSGAEQSGVLDPEKKTGEMTGSGSEGVSGGTAPATPGSPTENGGSDPMPGKRSSDPMPGEDRRKP